MERDREFVSLRWVAADILMEFPITPLAPFGSARSQGEP
jgi:hypothetical protein